MTEQHTGARGARGPRGERGPVSDTAVELLEAVRRLTTVVAGVDQLLRDEYPKRTEIERRFVSKMQQNRHVARMLIVALLTVAGCYAFSTGLYAVCFVGQEDPGACSVVPGYQERIERRDEINKRDADLERRIKRLEAK